MNYGFAIDNRSCIGCHACSTACKSENSVPLGVSRTWVKSVEVGRYPDVRRDFQVTRCNHCEDPPCARICPVTAMYRRPDGIVEFDGDVCIGCKGCLQACPYDAVHIDPATGTAAKCHFCAHRVEVGAEPACVVVCPTHSILAGDLDDPGSEISRFLDGQDTTVRKPEAGTRPNLFYVEGSQAAQRPEAAPMDPGGMAFAQVVLDLGDGPPLKTRPIGAPASAPPEGTVAGQMVQLAYNAQHKVPWHWQVPAYLVTKAIGTGMLMLVSAQLLWGMTLGTDHVLAVLTLALAMLAATTALLVGDLERPERFLRIVLRPQWQSWIARGAFILIGLSSVTGLWWGLELLGIASPRRLLAGLTLPLAVAGAGYTAFLFRQARGRDLWQDPELPAHMVFQAALAGAAALLLLSGTGWALPMHQGEWVRAGTLAVVADLVFTARAYHWVPSETEAGRRAVHAILRGRYARLFWVVGVGLGHVAPLVLLGMGTALPLAGALMLVGLYAFEHAFVMAPQHIPNS